MADFATNFKKLRLEKDLSQAELARQLGISKSSVNMYERGERKPDFELAERISDYFCVDLTYLLGITDKMTRLTGDDTDVIESPYVSVDASERELLRAYRHAGAETQAAIRAILHI
ncbi:helix-turn-helix domain-containing protein [Gemmiger sp.]